MRPWLLALLLLPLASAQTAPEGINVTLTSDQDEALRSPPDASRLAITWHVPDGYLPTDAPQVRYSVDGGAQQSVPAAEVGRTFETIRPGAQPPIDTDGAARMYGAVLPVARGQNVTYIVGEPQKGWSPEHTVRHVPPSNASMRVVAVADIGGFTRDGDDQAVQTAIRDLVLAQRPDLLVIPGDLAYSTTDASWGAWMRLMEPLLASVPMVAVPGNHEWQTSLEGYDQFKARFTLPIQVPTQVRSDEVSTLPITNRDLSEEFFAFAAGPAYFIGLNSDRICSKNTPQALHEPPCEQGAPEPIQYAWLREVIEDVTEDAQPAWLIPFFHHPVYSHGNHPGHPAVQALWLPLFDSYSADLVITAHDHNYQRTWPMRAGIERQTEGTEFSKGDGTVYVVTGGGGRSLYDMAPDPQPSWLAAANVTYHVTVVDVTTDRLDVRAVGLGNTTIDAFSIVRSAPDAAARGPGQDSPLPWWLCLGVLLALRRR